MMSIGPFEIGFLLTGGYVAHKIWKKRSLPTKQFIESMPKIELHAHLSGSIRSKTLIELLPEGVNASDIDALLTTNRTFEDCFRIFPLIHKSITCYERLYRVTLEIVEDYAKDNVKYLELRSCPRALEENSERKDYVETVLRAMRDGEKRYPGIICRFILSLNRRRSIEDAEEVLNLALKYQSDGVVGLDVSGPRGDMTFKNFKHLLQIGKENGLGITFHLAEWDDKEEVEGVLNNLHLVDRIGHAVFLTPDQVRRFQESNMSVEFCPTSNVFGKIVKSYEEHVFQSWINCQNSMTFNTDDSALFQVTLSDEYHTMSKVFNLDALFLKNFCLRGIDGIFDQSCSKVLKNRVKEFYSKVSL